MPDRLGRGFADIDSAGQPPAGASRIVIAGLGLLIVLIVLAIYTFLHESGHALIGLLFGGKLSEFNISFWSLNPHVGMEGEFSAAQSALIATAGIGLPLFAFLAFVALVPRRPSGLVEAIRLLAAMCVLNTLLPWMTIPFLYAAGRAPADDATNFLRISQAPPPLVAAVALALYAGGWVFFSRRIGGIRGVWARRHEILAGLTARDSIRDFRFMAAAGLAVIAAVVGSSIYFPSGRVPGTPVGYREVARASLAEEGLESRTVYGFTLKASQPVSFLFVLQDIRYGPGKIDLTGPDGDRTFFSIGPDAQIGRATVNPKDLPLVAGEYRVELTFPRQAGGQVGVYVKDGQ